MSQVDVDTSIGYAMKRATWALRGAMDTALRATGLGVPQYACLELLAHTPGISNADLARGVFVTRQATHQLLAGLRRDGLVAIQGVGRDQRLSLTSKGAEVLADATDRVASVEQRMLHGLPAGERHSLRTALNACAHALTEPPGAASVPS